MYDDGVDAVRASVAVEVVLAPMGKVVFVVGTEGESVVAAVVVDEEDESLLP